MAKDCEKRVEQNTCTATICVFITSIIPKLYICFWDWHALPVHQLTLLVVPAVPRFLQLLCAAFVLLGPPLFRYLSGAVSESETTPELD